MKITKENKFAVIAAICFAVIGGFYLYEYIFDVVWDVRHSSLYSDYSFTDVLYSYRAWMFPCYIAVTWTVLLMYRNKFAMRIAAGICTAEVFVNFISGFRSYYFLNVLSGRIDSFFCEFFFTWDDGTNLAWLLLFAVLLLYKNKKWKALQWMWLLPGAVCALSDFVAYIWTGIDYMCGKGLDIRSLNEILYLNVFESGNDWFGYYGIIMSAVRLLAHFATIGAFVCIGLWLRREASHDACAGAQAANDSLVRKKWNRGAILGCALVGTSIIVSIVIGILVPVKYENQIKQSLAAGLYEEAEHYCWLLDENDADGKSAKIKYNYALLQIEQENYVGAYTVLCTMTYKDSEKKMLEIYPQYKKALFAEAEAGKPLIFGAYEQDNDLSNGKEDIEWLILEVKDGRALVISKYALDCKAHSKTTWATSDLKRWLNSDFINTAFSADERTKIPTTKYNTNPGYTSEDKVFLLSIQEANYYFSSDEERECDATDYAIAEGAFQYDYGKETCWWLRSPGASQGDFAYVLRYGKVDEEGDYSEYIHNAVRPALWIDLGE